MNIKLKNTIDSILSILPGFLAAPTIAALSKWLESLLPIHLIGVSVIALFIGMAINQI